MAGAGEVFVELARGVARVGTRVLSIEAMEDGTLRVGGPAGPRLRRLLFAERTDVVQQAQRTSRPAAALAALLLERCLVDRGRGQTDPRVLQALCLHLCGADVPAPEFTRARRLVARATGWSDDEIGRQPAVEIDGLAAQIAALMARASRGGPAPVATAPAPGSGGHALPGGADGDGWTRLRLVADPSPADAARGAGGGHAGGGADVAGAAGLTAGGGAQPVQRSEEDLVAALVAGLLRRAPADGGGALTRDDLALLERLSADGDAGDVQGASRPSAGAHERASEPAHGADGPGAGRHGSGTDGSGSPASPPAPVPPQATAPSPRAASRQQPPPPAGARRLTLRSAAMLPAPTAVAWPGGGASWPAAAAASGVRRATGGAGDATPAGGGAPARADRAASGGRGGDAARRPAPALAHPGRSPAVGTLPSPGAASLRAVSREAARAAGLDVLPSPFEAAGWDARRAADGGLRAEDAPEPPGTAAAGTALLSSAERESWRAPLAAPGSHAQAAPAGWGPLPLAPEDGAEALAALLSAECDRRGLLP